jgi:hypothetical protein
MLWRLKILVKTRAAPENSLTSAARSKQIQKPENSGFFHCLDKGDYYWPADGFLSNGKLNIFMHVVRTDYKLPVPLSV